MRNSSRALILSAIALSVYPRPAAAERPVSFNRDIRPIMSDTCFHCHGFDAKTREAGLRLDLREEALKKTENDVFPIVPGKPDESAIIERIFSPDRDDVMPPPKAHKALTPKQKELFRRWVAEGAIYEPHWAYAPLARPDVPKTGDAHPVDALIKSRLAEKESRAIPGSAPRAITPSTFSRFSPVCRRPRRRRQPSSQMNPRKPTSDR